MDGLAYSTKRGPHAPRYLRLAAGAAITLVVASACVVAGAGLTPISSTATTAPGEPNATIPADKQTYLDRMAQAQASAQIALQSLGITKSDDPGSAPPLPTAGQTILDPTLPAGAGLIIQTTDGPPGTEATIENRWFEQAGNDLTVVFAGCDIANGSIGLVLVTAGPGTPAVRIAAPGQDGCLTITGAEGKVLTLRAKDGAEFHFDTSSLKFL